MQCDKCDTPIDYRFSTVCPHCQAELPSRSSLTQSLEVPRQTDLEKGQLRIAHHLVNALLVLGSATVCMVGGAVMMYGLAGILYRTFLYEPASTGYSHGCGRGMAIGILSILVGGFLGCTWGSIVSYRGRITSRPLSGHATPQ